jgi:hypothetical protein
MARLVRVLALVGATALLALGLSACGGSGAVSSARQACQQIHVSIATYNKAATASSSVEKETLIAKAQAQLLDALGPAAAATSADGSFNALMTTIGEASRVPENLLIPALQAQCKVVDSTSPYLAS